MWCKDNQRTSGGFSFVEMLVVVGIISVLTALLLPVLNKVRVQAASLKCQSNLKQILNAVNILAIDNDDRYPESVATIGMGGNFSWQDPRMMTGYMRRSPGLHRSMSAYLYDYIEDADVLFCPDAPEKYKYLQQMWDGGDDWDNPDTPPIPDPVFGTYCFYWNYIGFVAYDCPPFRGPWGPAGGRGRYSKLMVTDYFGYDNWRSPNSFGSSGKIKHADITEGTCSSSAFWSLPTSNPEEDIENIQISLNAGYIDGHVESFDPNQVIPMRVSVKADGSTPYPEGVGAGIFFLPQNIWP